MNKNIVIVHYNTPYLTECLVRSINLFVKNANIYIFDNSDTSAFTSSFDNVTVFDNTEGQYINFDEWLKQYPNRVKTSAFKNNYGSAKHCYSVQKCMELLKEPFILLDSDVLLKKDISEYFDIKYAFIGNIEFWKARKPVEGNKGLKPKARAIPYLCFINTPMCKRHNVNYFDSNHIYGLTANGDTYDTGAYFFEMVKKEKLPIKKINLFENIIHYKAGSWVEEAKKFDNYKTIDFDRWLNTNKKYWFKPQKKSSNNKYVVYTCITGGYDTIKEPTYISDNFDYVCFTDNNFLKSDIWDIRPLPDGIENLSQVKKQRYVKINPHKLLSEYDLSIWVDGNVLIKGDLNKLVSRYVTEGTSIYIPEHPTRKCIYDEAIAIISLKKDTKEVVNKQIEKYKKENYPKKNGLLQSNILLRKHNNEDCIKLMEEWFKELKDNSHRDQLSFNYVLWKNKNIKVKYLDKTIYKSQWFSWNGGHRKFKNLSALSVQKKAFTANTKRKSVSELREDFKRLIEKHNKLKTCSVGLYGA